MANASVIVRAADRPHSRKPNGDITEHGYTYIYLGAPLPWDLVWLKLISNNHIQLWSPRNYFAQQFQFKIVSSEVQSGPLAGTVFENHVFSEFSVSHKQLASKIYHLDLCGPIQDTLDKLSHRDFNLYRKILDLDLGRSNPRVELPPLITDASAYYLHLRMCDARNIPDLHVPLSHEDQKDLFVNDPAAYNSAVAVATLRDTIKVLERQLEDSVNDVNMWCQENRDEGKQFVTLLRTGFRLVAMRKKLASDWNKLFPSDSSFPLQEANDEFEHQKEKIFGV